MKNQTNFGFETRPNQKEYETVFELRRENWSLTDLRGTLRVLKSNIPVLAIRRSINLITPKRVFSAIEASFVTWKWTLGGAIYRNTASKKGARQIGLNKWAPALTPAHVIKCLTAGTTKKLKPSRSVELYERTRPASTFPSIPASLPFRSTNYIKANILFYSNPITILYQKL